MASYDIQKERSRLEAKLELVNKAIEIKCKDLIEERDSLLKQLDQLTVKGYRVNVPSQNRVKYGQYKDFMVSSYGYLELTHKCAKEYAEKVQGVIYVLR